MPIEMTELITKVLDVSSDREDITTGLWDGDLNAYVHTGILKNVNKVKIEKGDNLVLHGQNGELIPEITLRPVADINDASVRALFKVADGDEDDIDGDKDKQGDLSKIDRKKRKKSRKKKDEADNSDVEDDTEDEDKRPLMKVLKFDYGDQQLVSGVVLQPETRDAHGDVMSAEEIEKSAHEFMVKSRVVGEQHRRLAKSDVVESYIAPIEMKVGDKVVVKKGTWLMTTKVHDPDLWSKIKSGEITGFSPGGHGKKQDVIKG